MHSHPPNNETMIISPSLQVTHFRCFHFLQLDAIEFVLATYLDFFSPSTFLSTQNSPQSKRKFVNYCTRLFIIIPSPK